MSEPAKSEELYALKFSGRIRWHYIHSSPNHLRKMVMDSFLPRDASPWSWEKMIELHPEFEIIRVLVSEIEG